MDGRSRNSRRKATSSVVAEGPTVPSSNCASISVAPVKKLVFWRRAKPLRTFEAISQERGVGPAFTSNVALASCRSAGLNRRKAMISGRSPARTAHWHQSSKSGSRLRWTKRLRTLSNRWLWRRSNASSFLCLPAQSSSQ